MNLQSEVSARLWAAVENAYEAGNYSHAILEAMHVLTNLLREKAGVDGDGAALVGFALGGDNPRIKLNQMQTDSERNVQRGVEHIIRGLYIGVRNPRSHDAVADEQSTADAIIYFINYLLGQLDASTEAFTVERFWSQVTDAEFVDSPRYAEALLAEVPPMRRGDAMIFVFRNRLDVSLPRRRALIRQLLDQLTEPQLASYLAVVSAELRTATEDAPIRTALMMLKPDHWPRLGDVARLRIEQRLSRGIRDGEVLLAGRGQVTESLATWGGRFTPHFTSRAEVAALVVSKFEDADLDDRAWISRFFMAYLPALIKEHSLIDRAVGAIASAVRDNDANVTSALLTHVSAFPEEWTERLKTALADRTDPKNPAVVLGDGSPFLSSPTADGKFDDDIPF